MSGPSERVSNVIDVEIPRSPASLSISGRQQNGEPQMRSGVAWGVRRC